MSKTEINTNKNYIDIKKITKLLKQKQNKQFLDNTNTRWY